MTTVGRSSIGEANLTFSSSLLKKTLQAAGGCGGEGSRGCGREGSKGCGGEGG